MSFLYHSTKTPFDFDPSVFMEEFADDSLRSDLISIRLRPESDQVEFEFGRELDLAEKSHLDSVVTGHEPISLGRAKKDKRSAIDAKTGQLIGQGFSFDGKVFSLSIYAQVNWNMLKLQETQFNWPVEVSTIDDQAYLLQQTSVTDFWNTGKDTYKTHLDSGRALKLQVNSCSTVQEVDAVQDNR